jgi:hypothetical protein
MKRGLDWYAREPRSFLDGVRAAKMTARQVVIYGIIIDLIYDGGGETPDDPKHIASYLSDMGAAAVRATVEQLIAMGKIYRVGTMLKAEPLFSLVNARPPIPSWLKDVIYSRDGGVCSYCGSSDGPFEIDHILPWARGGNHSPDNLTIACRPCNRSKGSKTVAEWKAASHG